MTEYGVQTNNLFDLLNENEGAAAAKPKAKQAGQQQPKKKAQAPKPAQPAKQAQPKKQPEAKPAAQPKPAAAPVAQPTGADEGFKTVGRSGQTQTAPAASSQQVPAARQGGQGQSGPRPQGPRGPSQGGRPQGGQGGQFRQGGQGGQGGQFRQGGQGGQGGQFRQGGQGGQFRQGGQGGQFRQGGQGGGRGNFRRDDRLDDRHVSFDEKEGNALPNKATAEGPRQKEDTHVAPPKTGAKGREFDRQSGTGRPPNEQKKGGSGPGNWGKPGEDELKAEADVQAELAAGAEGAAPAAGAEGAAPKKNKKKKKKTDESEEGKEKKDEIPDEKLVLFDEYQKQQEKKNKVKVKLPALRQAGEGAKEDPTWADATKLDRGGDGVVFFTAQPPKPAAPAGDKKRLSKNQYKKAKERKAREAARQKLEKDNIVNLFDFSAPKKEREDRGDRPAGGRGRGNGPRPPRGSGGPRGSPKEGGDRQPRNFPGGRGGNAGGSPAPSGGAPKKFTRASDAPQFDDSSFPALQLGP